VIAQSAVHTAGINWESVTAIAGCVAVIMTVVIWVFNRRDHRQAAQNDALRTEFTHSIDALTQVLLAKLETKDTVARISERLARVEAVVSTNDR
jgi:sensor domain CHASE-containing protein